MEVFLSDRTRRLFCRVGFIAICLIPTVVVLRWILLPVSASHWEDYLQRKLGLPVSIEEIVSKSPQQTQLTNVLLGSDQSGSKFSIDLVSIENSAKARLIQISGAAGTADALWKSLTKIAAQEIWRDASARPYVLTIGSLAITQNDSPDSQRILLKDVRLETTADRSQMVAHATLENDYSGQPVGAEPNSRVSVTFAKRAEGGATSVWSLKSDQAIPVWILHAAIPKLSFLNADCKIQGSAQVKTGEQGSITAFQGTLSNVSLLYVVGQRFGQLLTGSATVRIDYALARDSQIAKLQGAVESARGAIGPDLLQACIDHLAMRTVEASRDGHYTHLAVEFKLDQQDLIVTALQPSGIVAYNGQGHQMLLAAQGTQHTTADLVSLLSFQAGWSNREILTLMQHLFLPAIETSRLGQPYFDRR